MRRSLVAVLAGCTVLVSGCVSSLTHKDTLAQLQESRNTSAQRAAEIAALEQDRLTLLGELLATRAEREKALADLEFNRLYLANDRQILNDAESRLSELQNSYQRLDWDRDLLQEKLQDLTVTLERTSEDLTSSQQSLKDAHRRIKALEQERDKVRAALAKTQHQAKALEAALAADHESWTRLRRALSKVEKIDARSGEPAGRAVEP